MKKTEIKELIYKAPYDHEAALQLAHEYLTGDNIARDKYKALEYYQLFQKLSHQNPNPSTKKSQTELEDLERRVKEELKKSLSLNDNLESTAKTKARKIASTGTVRRSLGLIGLAEATGSRMASFLTVFRVYSLYNVFSKIPLFSAVLLTTQIALDAGIVAKNGLRRARKEIDDSQSNWATAAGHVAKEVKLSLKKDGRLARLLSASVWVGISVASMVVAAVAAPLLVVGSAFDMAMTLRNGFKAHFELRKEKQFIRHELADIQRKLETIKSDPSPLNDDERNWLTIKQKRLELRVRQLDAASNRNQAKTVAELVTAGTLLVGAALLVVPNPITQVLGLVTIGLGGLAYFGLKLILGLNKVNVTTAPAIPQHESAQDSVPADDVNTNSSQIIAGALAQPSPSAALSLEESNLSSTDPVQHDSDSQPLNPGQKKVATVISSTSMLQAADTEEQHVVDDSSRPSFS